MSAPSRFLTGNNSSPGSPPPQPPLAVDSDFVVILAALLCALICVVGLVAVARCAWLRRYTGDALRSQLHVAANKGLKKKILRSIPRLTFNGNGEEVNGKLVDCAICLTEFVDGDEIRVLPQCGHGFHVGCIDMWLGSHSSCPSCRRVLVFKRCKKCGGVPETSATSSRAVIEAREDHVNSFLP
ncbi:hypothetical protein IFM89_035017 [Coptis chinensis]|uniref:RING-type domain-containing protein n=1 Tax=Coptis chinensis TaxID=261450 RepID=A0A835HRZ0_9MAGN|nr:hypothetical protein IFM89_035017 [Coptis chinensis]